MFAPVPTSPIRSETARRSSPERYAGRAFYSAYRDRRRTLAGFAASSESM
jgi:hypothetical protein